MADPSGLQVHVSCPGKVLVVGGYLVLDEATGGAVLAATARFHVTISPLPGSLRATSTTASSEKPFLRADEASGSPASSSGSYSVPVYIDSPQFHTHWRYSLVWSGDDGHGLCLRREREESGNQYVDIAINTAFAAVNGLPAEYRSTLRTRLAGAADGLYIRLEAENDFYSQIHHLKARGQPLVSSALAALPQFLPCPLQPDGKVLINKTGLGSSAALVSSTVGATLAYFCDVKALGGEGFRRLAHDCAQIAHGLAQGKIGSGFDIASACYGSIQYKRIPAAVLGELMERTEKLLKARQAGDAEDDACAYLYKLSDTSAENKWHFTVKPFGLPRGLSLVLADVAGGSETPGMVRSVLHWRATAEQDTQPAEKLIEPIRGTTEAQIAAMVAAADVAVGPKIWRLLAAANERVAVVLDELRALYSSDPKAYDAAINACAGQEASEWRTGGAFAAKLFELKESFGNARTLLRDMGHAANVPIEPDAQTSLADATVSLRGVVASGVPGAGGFDALFVIHLVPTDGSDVRASIEHMWEAYSGVTPLLLKAGEGRGEEGAGMRIHT